MDTVIHTWKKKHFMPKAESWIISPRCCNAPKVLNATVYVQNAHTEHHCIYFVTL